MHTAKVENKKKGKNKGPAIGINSSQQEHSYHHQIQHPENIKEIQWVQERRTQSGLIPPVFYGLIFMVQMSFPVRYGQYIDPGFVFRNHPDLSEKNAGKEY